MAIDNSWDWVTGSGRSMPQTPPTLGPAPWETEVAPMNSAAGLPPVEQPISESPVPDTALPEAPQPPAPIEPPPPLPTVKTGKYGIPEAQTTADYAAQMAPVHQAEVESNNRMAGYQQQADEQTATNAGQVRDLETDAMVHEAAIQRDKQQAMGEADQKVAAAEQAIKEIDPNHFWSSRDAGQKAAGFMAVALGGFLSPYNGGNNSALEDINRAIDQDIAVQQQNQELGKFKVGQAEKGRGRVQEQYGDLLNDANLQRAGRLRALIAENTAAMAKINSPINQEKALQLNNTLEGAYRQSILKAHENEVAARTTALNAETAIKTQRAAAGAQARAARLAERQQVVREAGDGISYDPKTGKATVLPQAPNLKTEAEIRKLNAEAAKLEREGGVTEGQAKYAIRDPRDPQKVIGYTTHEDVLETRNTQQAVNSYHQLKAKVATYEKLARQGSVYDGIGSHGGLFTSDRKKKMDQLRNDIAADYAIVKNGGGKPSDFDVKNAMDNLVPGYDTPLTADTTDASFKNFNTAIDDAVRLAVGGTGIPLTPDNDPTTPYKDVPRGPESPQDSAVRAATTFRPDQLGDANLFQGADPEKQPRYPLNDVQVSVPVQAMTQMALRGNAGESPEQKAVTQQQALQYLKAVASDPENPASAEATQALKQLGK